MWKKVIDKDKDEQRKSICEEYSLSQRFFIALKCAEIPFFAGLFLFISITTFRSLGFEKWYARPLSGATSTFTDDLSSSSTYKDSSATTAEWYGRGPIRVSPTSTFVNGQWISPNTGTAYFEDIDCSSTTVCYTVGNTATILKTTDGGITWTKKFDSGLNLGGSPVGSTVPGLEAIEVIDANTVIGVGRMSWGGSSTREFAVRTTDGGDTWTQVLRGTANYFDDVFCWDANNCIIVGGNHTNSGKLAWTSSNGGISWTAETLPSGSYDLYGVHAFNDGASTTIHAVGTSSTILKAQGTGPGYTWTMETTTSTTANAAVFRDIRCMDINNCILVGDSRKLFRTGNGGTTWTQISTGYTVSVNVRNIDCVSSATSTCWIIADDSTRGVRKATDGQTFNAVTPAGGGLGSDPEGLKAVSTSVAYVVGGINGGGRAFAIKTTDGDNWTDLDTICCTSQSFNSIKMLNATTGYAVGSSGAGTVAKTTDGTTWADTGATGFVNNGVDFVSAAVGWAVGNNGDVAKTTNNGTSWSDQTCTGCSANLQEIDMWNANVGYLVGGSGLVRKTTDGGATGWISVTSTINSTSNSWFSVYTVSTSTVYIGGSNGSNGIIYKTTDGGDNWTQQFSGTSAVTIDSISCLEENGTTCWALASNGGDVLKTTNGGTTWTRVSDSSNGGGTGGKILFITDNIGFHVMDTFFYQSINGGSVWSATSSYEGQWRGMDRAGDTLWIVGVTAGIDRISLTSASSSVAQSTTIDTVSQDILCANATFTSTTPAGTSITVELSNNGGTNWISPGGSTCASGTGLNFNFSTSGSDLRWKATLTSGSSPEITSASITYSYNQVPNTPTNTSPANGATNVVTNPTLTSSAFSDPDSGDTHTTSQWVISDNSGNGTVFQNTGASSTDLTSHTVTGLSEGVTYGWSVKHCDQLGACSASSATTTFSTAAASSGGGGSSSETRLPPSAPISGSSTARSSSEIRWEFKDTANNEQGFELRDASGKVLYSTSPFVTTNLSFIDEKNLSVNTSYCGRQVFAFNSVGYSAGSDPYPCRATLANRGKAPRVIAVAPTEVVLAIDTSDNNPSVTEYAIFETITKTWVALTAESLSSTATSTWKYELNKNPVWQNPSNWGTDGFKITNLEQGTTYSFQTRVRNLDKIETLPDENSVSLVTTTISGAKVSITLGVEIGASTAAAAGTVAEPKNREPITASRKLFSLAVFLPLLLFIFSPGALGPKKQKVTRHRSRLSSASPSLAFTVLSLMLLGLVFNSVFFALGSEIKAQGEFADNGKSVSPGQTLAYRAIINSIGTETVTSPQLRIPIPAGTQYVQGSIVFDGVSQSDAKDATDDGYLNTNGAVVNLPDMLPGSSHIVMATVRVLSTAVSVSNTAIATAKELSKTGVKSNTVTNPVKTTAQPPPPPPPAEEPPPSEPPPSEPPPSSPTRPVAPTIAFPENDSVINDDTPTITGKTSPNSTVTIFIDGEEAGKVQADGSGNYSFTPSTPLQEGEHTVQTEVLGQRSGITRFTIDTTPPPASEVEAFVVREIPGTVPGTFDTTILVRGTATSDVKTVTVSISEADPEPGDVPSTQTIEPDGPEWEVFQTVTLNEGESYNIAVFTTDEAGNKSSVSVVQFAIGPPQCADGIDNDEDTYVDFPADFGCTSANDVSELEELLPLEVKPQCSDGLDNDSDGFIDYPADSDCEGFTDTDEANIIAGPISVLPECADGRDNDIDGAIDFPVDAGCSEASDASETDFLEDQFRAAAAIAGQVARFIRDKVIDNPAVEETNEKAVVPAAVFLVGVNLAAASGIGTIISWLQLLASQPLLLLARRKRRGYGVVYNSLSKLPVDLASIRLIDNATGRVAGSAVTDKAGRFYFLPPPGNYRIEVVKPGFNFPTTLLLGAGVDANYTDLYTGGTISLPEGNAVTKSLPADPALQDLPRDKVLGKNRLKRTEQVLAALGPVIAGFSFIISPKPLVAVAFAAHLVLYALFARLALGWKPKTFGVVLDAHSGKPVGKAIVRIFSRQYNKLMETRVTDAKGRYAFLVGKSEYYLTAEHPNYVKKQSRPLDFKDSERPEVVTEKLSLEPVGSHPTPAPLPPPPIPPQPPPPPSAPPPPPLLPPPPPEEWNI